MPIERQIEVQEDSIELYIAETRTFDTNYYVVHALEKSFDALHVDYLVDEGAWPQAIVTETCWITP